MCLYFPTIKENCQFIGIRRYKRTLKYLIYTILRDSTG